MCGGQRGARKHDLGISLPSPIARGVDRLRAPRHDPAVVLVPGRRGTAVLAGQPAGPGTIAGQNDGACRLAIARNGLSRGLPPFDRPPPDRFHVRGYPVADWPGLHIPLPAGHAVGARAVDCVRRHRGGLLGALRGLSGAPGFRLPGRRRSRGLAASDERLPGALEQEQQSSLGVRRLVPQPVPAVRAVPGQRRGLRDAQLHSHAGDDDPG